jgi:hypothetical protein
MGRTGAINAKVCATKSQWNFSLRTHPIHTMGPKTHVLSHFVMLGCITALNSVQNGPNWCNLCKSLFHEVASKLFATNAPDTNHGTQNSYFVAFRNVWVHLGSFRYCTKLGTKWAKLEYLMQKFVPRSRVGTFRYEHTRYKPWDSKLIFCCIS